MPNFSASTIQGMPFIAPNVGTYEAPTSFAITTSSGSGAPGTATYRRTTEQYGEWAFIRWEFVQTAAGTSGGGDYLLPLPSGLAINYSKVGTLTPNSHVGQVGTGSLQFGTTVYEANVHVSNSGAYTNRVHLYLTNEAQAAATWSATLAPFGGNASIIVGVSAWLPIVGWAPSNIQGSPLGAGGLTPALLTATATAASNTAYAINMTTTPITLTLPAGTNAATVSGYDYLKLASLSKTLTLVPPAGQNIDTDPVGDGIIFDYPGYEFTVHRPQGSTTWYWRKQNVVLPQPANSSTFGSVAPRKGQYDLTIGSSEPNTAKTRAVGIYYQDQDGVHRLKFNVSFTFTSRSITTSTPVTLTITGVVFKSGIVQALSGLFSSVVPPARFYTSPGVNSIGCEVGTTVSSGGISVSGDVELDSKPTWA